jgi:hypothetical protein
VLSSGVIYAPARGLGSSPPFCPPLVEIYARARSKSPGRPTVAASGAGLITSSGPALTWRLSGSHLPPITPTKGRSLDTGNFSPKFSVPKTFGYTNRPARGRTDEEPFT